MDIPKSSDLTEPILLEKLATFKPANLLLYARTEKPQNKSERLIFNLIYVDGNKIKAFNITYTSKNAPPIIEKEKGDNDLLRDVAVFNYTLFRQAYPGDDESRLWYNTLATKGKALKNVITQPPNAATSTVTENIITKKDIMFDGFRILPMRHKMEKQWEGAFVYSDERSTFFVQPDEEVFTPLRIYDGYYFLDTYRPIKSIDKIPNLIQETIKGWPPVQTEYPAPNRLLITRGHGTKKRSFKTITSTR